MRHLWGGIRSLGCGSGVQGCWEQVAVVRIRQRAVICGVQSQVGLRTAMCETSVDRPCYLQAGTQEVGPWPVGVGEQGQTSTWAGVAGSNVDRSAAETKGELGRATLETRG